MKCTVLQSAGFEYDCKHDWHFIYAWPVRKKNLFSTYAISRVSRLFPLFRELLHFSLASFFPSSFLFFEFTTDDLLLYQFDSSRKDLVYVHGFESRVIFTTLYNVSNKSIESDKKVSKVSVQSATNYDH